MSILLDISIFWMLRFWEPGSEKWVCLRILWLFQPECMLLLIQFVSGQQIAIECVVFVLAAGSPKIGFSMAPKIKNIPNRESPKSKKKLSA